MGKTAINSNLLFTLLFFCAFSSGSVRVGSATSAAMRAVSAAQANSDIEQKTFNAAACKRTVERFIQNLDAVLTESPRSIDRYNAVLARSFPYRQGFPGMPQTAPDSSVVGCNADQVIDVAKRSKFLYEIGLPPRYQHYRIEFRGLLAKVYFSIDRDTGNIHGAGAWWIQPYL